MLLVLLAGCQKTARKRVQGDIVKSVSFEVEDRGFITALSGQSDYQLQGAIETKGSPFGTMMWPLSHFVEPSVYREDDLAADAYRLENWYAHHGWFDARVEGWQLRTIRPRQPKKAGVVNIVGIVNPGEPSTVRKFEIRGLESHHGVLLRSVLDEGYISEGARFDLDAVNAARDLLISKLQNASYAYAVAEARIEAFPDAREVEVTIVADPGPSCTLGLVTIEGNEAVDTSVIADTIKLVPDSPYRRSDLGDAERRLFDLRTFSVVSVEPDLSDRGRTEVPVRVKVTETDFRRVRIGGGVDYDGLTIEPRASSEFEHVNLFHELIHLEARLEAGYAYTFAGTAAGGLPVYLARVGLEHPRVFGRKWSLALTGEAEQDLQSGQFAFFSPRGDLKLAWKPDDHNVVSFGPHAEQFRFLALDTTAELAARAAYGEGFRNPYTLLTMDTSWVRDTRDDPLFTRRGWFTTLALRQAVPFRDEDYFYTQLEADIRKYWSVTLSRRLAARAEQSGGTKATRILAPEVIAVRGDVDVLKPWSQRPLPYPERAFLGGSADHRGFRTHQVGPYDCLCIYADQKDGDPFTGEPGAGRELIRYYPPEGGAAAALGQVESRHELTSSLLFVEFFDVGLLAQDWSSFLGAPLAGVRVAGGTGVRYRSPVGPIRVDLSFRPLYPEDAGPEDYVNCFAEDRLPRSYDIWSLPRGSRDVGERALPFAFNVFIAIGEAI